jgi:hypothetical protein
MPTKKPGKAGAQGRSRAKRTDASLPVAAMPPAPTGREPALAAGLPPLPPPKVALPVVELLARVESAAMSGGPVEPFIEAMNLATAAVGELPKPERDKVLPWWVGLTARCPPPAVGMLAIWLGAGVERGRVPPETPFPATLSGVKRMLPELTRLADACVAAAQAEAAETAAEARSTRRGRTRRAAEEPEPEPVDPIAAVERHSEGLAAADPGLAAALRWWRSANEVAMGFVAMAARSKANRAAARSEPGLPESLAAAAGILPDTAFFLPRMVSVLDDEDILVLHPGQERGFVVRIAGIADNFQLHTLLADALIGDARQGWIKAARGTKPTKAVVAAARDGPILQGLGAAGAFNLVNWTGLRSDGTIGDGHDHWIWNEGVPADIAAFDGRRVILLQDPPYLRTWNAGRCFPDMKAELAVAEKLDADRVRALIGEMAARAGR